MCISQILGMNDAELEWLSNHLGHKISTHMQFYRQHEGVIEIAKIGKLLLATEDGKVGKFGKQGLDGIQAEGKTELYIIKYPYIDS